MNCPNCDAPMFCDEDDPDVWHCEECGFVEDLT